MTRSVKEWIGKNDDEQVPPRVRARVFQRYDCRCYLCTRKIMAGEYWECDHVQALANGGPNRESNLKPACCNCCKPKTARDVAEKSKTARVRAKHLGIKKTPSFKGKPMPGTKASGVRKRMNGRVERWT